ncbi:tRNA (carboxymethyluridine(34)-5-O)-methyltransferase [Malassezia vespertilionis]|uniref:Mediator of RNA polymerase II transcription subunit 1 n=1 Tax=Malassezia vespertilionis TaxID=2020962 RepID=A0A2N1J700_9BASI|nr:tRNA (carboxymethyluridine(34)-5-O)-methyltransferase [Malassezia vespertilionis]PKI82331.1 hypothetical protein MVES_003756 [Malassezia vespertilionis]WFD08149.1 tRNA (carboxymethyluridine(34)-5-O)-methyltransferase [Malassezia vespertilionis]
MAEAQAPASAYELVTWLRRQLHALRESTRDGLDEEMHAFSQLTTSRIGLYGKKSIDVDAGQFSPETWSEAMQSLTSSSSAFRATLETMHQGVGGTEEQLGATAVHELNAQARELTHAAMDLRAAATLHDAMDAGESLPRELWTGRLKDAQTAPLTERGAAVQVLDVLCSILAPVATRLHLECFEEKLYASDDVEMQDASKPVQRTHTFTSGGRIIVLDVELGVAQREHTLAPHIMLHISYAHDETMQEARVPDTRLADMMRNLLLQLAYVLFGYDADPAVLSTCPVLNCEGNETRYVQATRLWCALARSLATLARIDALSANALVNAGTDKAHKIDLFAQLESMGLAAERVSAHELGSLLGEEVQGPVCVALLRSLSQTSPAAIGTLLRCGHGVALQHVFLPYLTIVYHAVSVTNDWLASGFRATVRVAPSAVPFAPNARDHVDWVSLPTGARPPQELMQEVAQTLCTYGPVSTSLALSTLGAGTQMTVHRPISYIAFLDPPVLVPHYTARSLWALCNLAQHPWSEQLQGAAVSTEAAHNQRKTDYLAQLCAAPGLSSTSDYTFQPSALHTDSCEARRVSIIPFGDLAQLYAALALLREHARFAQLLAGATTKHNTQGVPVTLKLGPCTRAGSSVLYLSFPVTCATPASDAAPAIVNATLRTTAEHASGWAIEASVVAVLGGELKRMHATDHAALACADHLAQGANIYEFTKKLVTWAHAA